MTIDEAIKHCKEKVEHLRDGVRACQSMTATEQADCLECANEHEQLAKWLEDYKRLLGERPQGEWIWRETGTLNFRYGYFTCSNCSFVSKAKQNFCAECGADMRKGGTE